MATAPELPDGMTPIPRGKIAAIVTHCALDLAPDHPAVEPAPPEPGWRFEHLEAPSTEIYRDLHRRIGGPHLWYSRLALDEPELAAILTRKTTRLHVLTVDGVARGMAELDLASGEAGEAELVFFGVEAALAGTRAARFAMTAVLARSAALGLRRLTLHTNTIDHPRALPFYRRTGFSVQRQSVEIADDPRLGGLLPPDTAPGVPILRP